MHWRRHSEGGERVLKGMERVSVCVCVGECSGGCTI